MNKPVVVDPRLSELSDGDLDALMRLVERYEPEAWRAWGLLHAAILDERLRRARLHVTGDRPGGGCALPPPVHLTLDPCDLKPSGIEAGFNSIRQAYITMEPATHEYTSDGCRARALCGVLARMVRGFHTAAHK